jgi:hypothetical protein
MRTAVIIITMMTCSTWNDQTRSWPNRMVRIAISAEAFEAIAWTLPLSSVGYENETNERGERYLRWIERWSTGCARCMDLT